jgi:hypothetical protein
MKTKQGQNFLDAVIQETGSIDNAFAMSLINSYGITDDIPVDTELLVTGSVNTQVTSLWGSKRQPASALLYTDNALIIPADGIGAMIIEDTFIIF